MGQRTKRADTVERKALEVLKRFGLVDPPVGLEDICRAEGLAVCARPFDYVAGLFLNDDVFPVIVVNSRQPSARQRFTVAHELGHYYLRHERGSFAEPGGGSRQERDAERFAANLLMPAAWVRRYWATYGANPENRISILAAMFEVSRAALRVRLKELGLDGPVGKTR
jgi:Zn-dependent peptidase ImmA (M78 family)